MDEYHKIRERYADPKDRDKAREEIGRIYADKEQPSGSSPATTYRSYYQRPYANYYDKLPPSEKTPVPSGDSGAH